MFGDSPWDYMTEEEKQDRKNKWKEAEKLKEDKAKEWHLQQLKTYSDDELLTELNRRQLTMPSFSSAYNLGDNNEH